MIELTDILKEEFDIYAKYLKLAEKKKEALIKNNIDILPKITDIERKLSTKVLQLENKRKNILRKEGFDSTVKIGELLDNIKETGREDVDLDDLEAIARKLKNILTDCRKFNENNMALIRQSSSYINHMIKVFTKADKSSESATYTKDSTGKIENIKLADLQG